MQARPTTARQARKFDSGMGGNIELDGEESRWIEGASEALPRERLHDGDNSENVSVELRELDGRNPKFLVRAAARELNGVALRSDVVDRKLGHEARVAGLGVDGVPVASDSLCVLKRRGRRSAGLEGAVETPGIRTER
jgi:hypothetical protein